MQLLIKNTEPVDPAPTRELLLGLLKRRLIPQVAARHPVAAWARPAVDVRAVELAHLLLAADPRAARGLVEERHAQQSVASLCASLAEPAARCLGNLWAADDCSEIEVTLGLHRLQVAIRGLPGDGARKALLQPRVVLIAPQPGEAHMFGSVIDAELLWRAGWDTQIGFPATDRALQALLAGTRFDVLDLSLSASFRRDHCLARMTQTITDARAASLNPALVVVVGGRVFSEDAGAAVRVGADAGSQSAAQVVPLLLEAMTLADQPLH